MVKDYEDDHKKQNIEMLANRVVSRYFDYQIALRDFKASVGLTKIENVHEPVSGLIDKVGRVVRHIKHNDRNDPKDSYPSDAAMNFQGCMSYLDMVAENFDMTQDDWHDGMVAELMKAMKQHSKGDTNVS